MRAAADSVNVRVTKRREPTAGKTMGNGSSSGFRGVTFYSPSVWECPSRQASGECSASHVWLALDYQDLGPAPAQIGCGCKATHTPPLSPRSRSAAHSAPRRARCYFASVGTKGATVQEANQPVPETCASRLLSSRESVPFLSRPENSCLLS